MKNMDGYSNSLPVTKRGMAADQFVSGRIAAGTASHGGIVYVSYVGRQDFRYAKLFSAGELSAFQKLLRMQVLIDGQPYYMEPQNTLYYPFGYQCECVLGSVRLQVELALDQNVLLQRIRVLDNPEGHSIRGRLLQHGMCGSVTSKEGRGWEIRPDGSLAGEMVTEDGAVPVEITSNLPCNTYSRHDDFKYYMETQSPSQEILFALSFDGGQDPSNREASPVCPDGEALSRRMDRLFERYHSGQREGLRFSTGSEALDSALNNVGPTLDALAVSDSPGAVRASQHYWIWGWDSMVHAEAYLWSGRAAVVRDMLDFYRQTADPEEGIGHAFATDYRQLGSMKACSQGLYVVLLYNYYAATGDRETLLRNLPFASHILELARSRRHPACSLGTGIGYFPDFPQLLEQREEDISLINNSLYLQALSCMAALEEELGLPQAEEHAGEAASLKADMERVLWDDQEGYWADSARGEDLARRPYRPLYGQLYVSPFGCQPRWEERSRIAAYSRERFLFDSGLYMFAPRDPGFMADGNQLGAYYPPTDRYYWNIMNAVDDTAAAEDFRRIVERSWSWHTYPEGLTHETVNEDPTPDNPGCKQAFTMKSWLCDAVELHLGLKVYLDGFCCHPLGTGKAFTVDNLVLRGRRLCFQRLEDGTLLLNGRALPGRKILWSELDAF